MKWRFLIFYGEMIEDRIEDGLSEEDAVSEIGSVDEIAAQIIADTPFVRIAKERMKPNRQIRGWEILLLVLGSPLWFSLGIAAFALIFSIYISVWAIIISLWAVFASFIICSLGCIAASSFIAFGYDFLIGAAFFAAGLIFAGLSIFMFYGFKAMTKGILICTKESAVWFKNRFVKKEGNA